MYKTRNAGTRNIPGNVLKHSRKCLQTFQRMSSNIPGNIIKHSGECCKHSRECHQVFRVISPNIPGNVLKHFRECCQTFRGMLPMFGVNENCWELLGRVAFRILSNQDGALLQKYPPAKILKLLVSILSRWQK